MTSRNDAGDRILTRVRSVLVDLGGVLETGCWPGLAQAWAPRLGITTRQMLAAVFGGSDQTVLVGRMSEDDWWQQHVLPRLGISGTALGRLRADIAARWSWDEQLLGCVARLGGRLRTAIVSNAWPHARTRLAADGVAGLVDEIVLSCEAGVAKPDRRIFELALSRLGAEPGRVDWWPSDMDRWLRRLAGLLPAIHAAPLSPAGVLQPFAPHPQASY